jgi:hypothetical protein
MTNGDRMTLAAGAAETERVRRRLLAAAILAIQIGVAAFTFTKLGLESPGLFPDLAKLAPLLAFSVALAAYLATVRRELVKSLEGKTGKERRDRKIEAIMVTGGEQATVLLGLLTVVRMVFLQGVHVHYDEFLIALLAVNVVYLGIVHLVEWMV